MTAVAIEPLRQYFLGLQDRICEVVAMAEGQQFMEEDRDKKED